MNPVYESKDNQSAFDRMHFRRGYLENFHCPQAFDWGHYRQGIIMGINDSELIIIIVKLNWRRFIFRITSNLVAFECRLLGSFRIIPLRVHYFSTYIRFAINSIWSLLLVVDNLEYLLVHTVANTFLGPGPQPHFLWPTLGGFWLLKALRTPSCWLCHFYHFEYFKTLINLMISFTMYLAKF